MKTALTAVLGAAAAFVAHGFSQAVPLPEPPGRVTGLFRGLRESIAYLRDPEAFLEERAAEFGPVFTTNIFFRKTVVVGSPAPVAEFIEREPVISTSSLPPTFQELHTDIGLLNLSGAKHTAQKAALGQLFSASAQKAYLPVAVARTREFIAGLAEKGEFALAPALKEFYLQLFAELFAGGALTDEEMAQFQDYNAGLLSLGKFAGSFKKGSAALESLTDKMRDRVRAAEEREFAGAEPLRGLCGAVDEDGSAFTASRVATSLVLSVWGAYVETAALVSGSLLLLSDKPDAIRSIREEGASCAADSLGAWKGLAYTTGVLREELRLNPPGGGGFRLTSEDTVIGGYTIPKGVVVTADPRIGNRMEALFPSPSTFAPERWVADAAPSASGEATASGKCPITGSASKLPRGGWFPGGIGVHGCPGVPLAELLGCIFLVEWANAFQSWEALDDLKYELIPIKIVDDAVRLRAVRKA